MYEIPELQVDAVHFAVSLAYYGLLRVPSKSESSDVDVCAFIFIILILIVLLIPSHF